MEVPRPKKVNNCGQWICQCFVHFAHCSLRYWQELKIQKGKSIKDLYI